MSFTTDIKQELCRVPVNRETVLPEGLGMLLFAGQFSRDYLRFQIEMPEVRRRVLTIFNQYMDVWPEESETTLTLNDGSQIDRIFEIYGYERETVLPLNRALVEDEQSKSAFLRGAFLIGGYAAALKKGYHLELVTTHYHVSRQMSALLNDMERPAHQVMRRGAYVLYYKDSDAIEDFLSAAGATGGSMNLMLTKVERELRNDVNRMVNCETANLSRTVSAAARQMQAIRRLEERGMLEKLPTALQTTARLRLEHPELSLSELCDASPEPISKPGLNNRLRRLVQLGEEDEE